MHAGILFDEEALQERGTSVAVFEYAHAMRSLHSEKVEILFNPTKSDPRTIEHFSRHFSMLGYSNERERLALVQRHSGYLYYYLRIHQHDIRVIPGSTIACHDVFDFAPSQEARFAYVSNWLSEFMTNGIAPVVPHIVELPPPQNIKRNEWKIPADATVVGRYGGYDSFDIPFAKRVVAQTLELRGDIWFVFVNTRRFVEHPRVLHFPAIFSKQEKSDFIGTCDLMLHARWRGESFGLAIAEFLFHDRPILCWGGGRDRNHVRMQPEPRNIYRTAKDLAELLRLARPYCGSQDSGRKDAIAAFTAKSVSQMFKKTFLEDEMNVTIGRSKSLYYELRRRGLNRLNTMRDSFYARS